MDSLLRGLGALEAWLPSFDPQAARAQALRFAESRFDREYLQALGGFASDHPRVAADIAARTAKLPRKVVS